MINHFTKLASVIVLVLTIPACSILSQSSPDLESTQAIVASPLISPTITRTSAMTPSPTHTLRPTRAPTTAPMWPPTAPTATQIAFEIDLQDNGTTVVTDWVFGYQFLMPQGWELTPGESSGSSEQLIEANYSGGTEHSFRLELHVEYTGDTLEEYLEARRDLSQHLGLDILREGITTNSHNTTLGFYESAGNTGGTDVYFHYYHIFIIHDREVLSFAFILDDLLTSTVQQAISNFQGSIQLFAP